MDEEELKETGQAQVIEVKEKETPSEKNGADKKVEEAKTPEEAVEEKAEEKPEEIEEPKKRIIVVDSKVKSLDDAISALRKGNYIVAGVESTEEFFAITSIESRKLEEKESKAITPEEYWKLSKGAVPDLLITAIDLNDLDGWEFILRLKFDNRYYEYKEMPVIVRTDVPITIETTKKIASESVHDYIPKSIKGKELLEKIDKYFETKQKLEETKKRVVSAAGYRVANEFERISLAIRIKLRYLQALKDKIKLLEDEGGQGLEIKKLEEAIYLGKREIIKYERRRKEIKAILKEKKDD